jgi:hypothetical protein
MDNISLVRDGEDRAAPQLTVEPAMEADIETQ